MQAASCETAKEGKVSCEARTKSESFASAVSCKLQIGLEIVFLCFILCIVNMENQELEVARRRSKERQVAKNKV